MALIGKLIYARTSHHSHLHFIVRTKKMTFAGTLASIVFCLTAAATLAALSSTGELRQPAVPLDVNALPPSTFYVILPSSGDGAGDANMTYSIFPKYGTTGRVARIRNPKNHWFVYCAGCEEGRCIGVVETVELQARIHQCRYATNGGPFGGPNCITPVIANGTLVSDLTLPSGYQCVAMMKNGSWVLGNVSRVLYPSILNLFCGFEWLVIDGAALTFREKEIAPRTTFGLSSSGEMISLVAEGSEVAYTGLTLNQTAAWMVELGAVWAINLDGGGSSTSWLEENSGVQGCPTCIDQPYCCSRSVTTISCIT